MDPALQKLPYHETGEGPWVGAEGNLGASSGWGTALLMFTLLAAVLYIGVFSGLNYRKGLRGRHLLPHRSDKPRALLTKKQQTGNGELVAAHRMARSLIRRCQYAEVYGSV